MTPGSLELRVAALDRMLRSHAGGLELQGVDARGVVRVRFTGMCVGCELKPVTAATVVTPALSALTGVTGVEIAGGRVSEHALAALQAGGSPVVQEILRAVERCEAEIGEPPCGS